MNGKDIVLENICKSYDGGRTMVLDHLSLNLRKGTVTTVQGRSGSGKTTLLNILGLLDGFDAGSYVFEGEPVKNRSGQNRILRETKVGFIFQNYALIENRTVEDNILIAGRYSKLAFSLLRKRTDALLERLSLSGFQKKRVSRLSGGEKQRAAIARALVKEPALILADEPSGNLDEENAGVISRVLKEYAEAGHTVLIVTHNPHIFRDADVRTVLEGGKLHLL